MIPAKGTKVPDSNEDPQLLLTDDQVNLWVASGGTGPPLALAHGGPGMWDYLEPLAWDLETIATVHRWDQRGAGRSQKIGPYTVDRFLRDMDAVREHAGVQKWISGGHSWGAVMALLYALRYPDRTLGVLYVAGNGLEWDQWRPLHRIEFERRLGPERLQRFNETSDPLESNRLRWSADYASFEIAEQEVERMLDQGFAVNQECNSAINAEMSATSEALLAGVNQLNTPVLIIQGGADPRPAACCDSLEAQLRNVERVVIRGAGHFPWVEKPDEFTELVSDWIAALPKQLDDGGQSVA